MKRPKKWRFDKVPAFRHGLTSQPCCHPSFREGEGDECCDATKQKDIDEQSSESRHETLHCSHLQGEVMIATINNRNRFAETILVSFFGDTYKVSPCGDARECIVPIVRCRRVLFGYLPIEEQRERHQSETRTEH